MRTFLPTFSRLDVAAHCVFPWTGGLRWPKQPPDAFRGVGSAVSSVAECLAVWGDAPLDAIASDLTPGDAEKLGHMAVHLRELLDREAATDQWRVAEQALAYNLRTGTARELRQSGPRDYSDKRPGEIFGTPDLVRRTADGRLVLRDYKTGVYARGKNPAESRQLRALGLCAARCYGADEVTVELAQVDAGGVHVTPAPVDAFELACCADELRGIYDRIHYEGDHPVPSPGHWCRGAYCPVRAVCPATKKALAAVEQAAELPHPVSVEIASHAQAAYVIEHLPNLEERLATIKQAVREYAREHGPIELSDGQLYGVVQCDGRESFDLRVPGAREAIEKHLGPFGTTMALKVSTSKSAIEAAAKAQQQQCGAGVKTARALFDELRELGALKQGAPFEKIEAFARRD